MRIAAVHPTHEGRPGTTGDRRWEVCYPAPLMGARESVWYLDRRPTGRQTEGVTESTERRRGGIQYLLVACTQYTPACRYTGSSYHHLMCRW